MNRVFHVLTESEPFSLTQKGSLSFWVVNALRNDPNAIVVAPSQDGSTGFDDARVRVASALATYHRMLNVLGYIFPWTARKLFLNHGLTQVLHDLQAGDTVWVHNRPETAVALQKFVRARGASLVLHLHQSDLSLWPRSITRALDADVCVFANRQLQDASQAVLAKGARTAVLAIRAEGKAFHPPAASAVNSVSTRVVFSGANAREEELRWFIETMTVLEQTKSGIEGVVIRGRDVSADGNRSRRRTTRVDLPGNIQFESPSTDQALGSTLRSANLFVRPGRWNEAASSEVHQALACRLPIAELGQTETQPNEQGYIASIRLAFDSKSAAGTLQGLEQEPEALRRLSAEAYRSYTRHVMWAGIHEDYSRILTSSRRAIGSEGIAEFFFAKA